MKKAKSYFSMLIIMALMAGIFAGCGSAGPDQESTATLNFAYQYGLQYLPVKIIKSQKLIEKYYDGDLHVNWQVLNSGAAVNEAMKTGKINSGIVGVPVAISGVNAGMQYKIIGGVSNIGSKLITNDESIKTLSDFKKNDQIALVNKGSLPHITLAMAAKELLGDAHALDDNIVAMSPPDGMTALLTDTVKGHYSTIPYDDFELAGKRNHEIKDVGENNATGITTIVTVLDTELYESDPKLYEAIKKAFEYAIEYIGNEENYDSIAEEFAEDEGITKEEMMAYLKSDEVVFNSDITGFMEVVSFMEDEDFISGDMSNDTSDYMFEGAVVKPMK